MFVVELRPLALAIAVPNVVPQLRGNHEPLHLVALTVGLAVVAFASSMLFVADVDPVMRTDAAYVDIAALRRAFGGCWRCQAATGTGDEEGEEAPLKNALQVDHLEGVLSRSVYCPKSQ
ncbi:hypothetical protein PG991_001558 [Apiospora marii]|uniref:Serine/threonine specific protein phosphatases domain-containing protein n=1 Tax=Apiospora marii TaxID=335849 RepID=A0ABR1SQ09_9PEZI